MRSADIPVFVGAVILGVLTSTIPLFGFCYAYVTVLKGGIEVYLLEVLVFVPLSLIFGGFLTGAISGRFISASFSTWSVLLVSPYLFIASYAVIQSGLSQKPFVLLVGLLVVAMNYIGVLIGYMHFGS